MRMAIVCVYYSILYNTIPYHTMPCPMVHGPWSTHPTQYIFPLNSCSRWITRYLPIHFTHSHTHREILLCSSSPTPLQHTHNTHTQYLLFFFSRHFFFPFSFGFSCSHLVQLIHPYSYPRCVLYPLFLCFPSLSPCCYSYRPSLSPPLPPFLPLLALLLPHCYSVAPFSLDPPSLQLIS